ncbi:MAG: UDP-glucose 4-epimerase, partial [Acidobacteria bacterium]|nr:UDP-glucose 4-epimerase [Acidobacteriota bacterium]
VSDLASAHVLTLDALRAQKRLVYNLGNGRGFSVREVIETARRVTGHPIPAKEVPRRPGDPAILVASSEKIRRELKWRPQYANLDDIVRSAWNWSLAHPNGYGAPKSSRASSNSKKSTSRASTKKKANRKSASGRKR